MFYIIQDNFFRDDLDNREVVVSIRCTTYNHEKYITQTLEGFVNQKTNFRFEAIVHDDASTDGTANIIREYARRYPSIIKPIFETENQYRKRDGSLRRIMNEHMRGKYIAYCEGDDYWTDPLKLQKQVDYLENHPDYVIAGCKYDKFYQKSKEIRTCKKSDKYQDISFDEQIIGNSIATLTVVIKSDILKEYEEFIKEAPIWSFGDYPIWTFAASRGKIVRIPESMVVYRVLEKSASHITDDKSRLKWAFSEFSMFEYFNSRFKIPKQIQKEALYNRCEAYERLAISTKDEYLISRIKTYYRENFFIIAWMTFCLACSVKCFYPIFDFIVSHQCIKSPIFYLKRKWFR